MAKFIAPVVRSVYGYDHDAVSADIGLSCDYSDNITVQSERDDADINVIVERFGLTGQLPSNVRVPLDTDFIEAMDFQSAMNAVVQARESFDAMPANVRARFNNDPAQFVEFCQDEKNVPEMIKLGLAVQDEVKLKAAQEAHERSIAAAAAAAAPKPGIVPNPNPAPNPSA